MTKDMYKEIQVLTKFSERIKVGDKAVLCWTAGSAGHYSSLATIIKVNPKSVVGTLDKPVNSLTGSTWPIGHKIRVPRALFNESKWQWYNVVMPIGLALELKAIKKSDTDADEVKSDDPVEYRTSKKASELYRSTRPQVCCSVDVFGEARRILYRELTEENFAVMHLNNKNEILEVVVVAIGTSTGCQVHPSPVFRKAILLNSTRLILLHNHPSGDPTPSQADLALTRRLSQAGELLGITVLDHMVLGETTYCSMADMGLMSACLDD